MHSIKQYMYWVQTLRFRFSVDKLEAGRFVWAIAVMKRYWKGGIKLPWSCTRNWMRSISLAGIRRALFRLWDMHFARREILEIIDIVSIVSRCGGCCGGWENMEICELPRLSVFPFEKQIIWESINPFVESWMNSIFFWWVRWNNNLEVLDMHITASMYATTSICRPGTLQEWGEPPKKVALWLLIFHI